MNPLELTAKEQEKIVEQKQNQIVISSKILLIKGTFYYRF